MPVLRAKLFKYVISDYIILYYKINCISLFFQEVKSKNPIFCGGCGGGKIFYHSNLPPLTYEEGHVFIIFRPKRTITRLPKSVNRCKSSSHSAHSRILKKKWRQDRSASETMRPLIALQPLPHMPLHSAPHLLHHPHPHLHRLLHPPPPPRPPPPLLLRVSSSHPPRRLHTQTQH